MVITHVDVSILDLTPRLQRKLSRGALVYGKAGQTRGKPVFVRLRTPDGVDGTAQLRPINPFQGETTESIVSAIRDYYAPLLLGRDPFDRQNIYRELEQVLPDNHSALCVVDLALHDLIGKALRVPVATLLGGRRDCAIPLEWSVGLGEPEAMVGEAVRAVRQLGLRIVCLKVGPTEHWRDDVEAFLAVRSAVGPDVQVGIDANAAYDVGTAIRVGKRLADHGLAYFEQPVAGWDLDGMARVRMNVGVPVLADESVFSAQDALRVIRAEACDGIVLKLYKCGGITGAMRVVTVAEAAGLPVNAGGTAQGSRLEAAAAAHLFASVPNHVFGAEFVMGLGVAEADPVVPDEIFSLSDGAVNLPSGPGLGVRVDLDAVRNLSLATYSVG